MTLAGQAAGRSAGGAGRGRNAGGHTRRGGQAGGQFVTATGDTPLAFLHSCVPQASRHVRPHLLEVTMPWSCKDVLGC